MLFPGERGVFWWGRTEMGAAAPYPKQFSQGQFSVDEKGIGTCLIDGRLVTDQATRDALEIGKSDENEFIAGKLIKSNKSVFLASLTLSAHSFSTTNIPTETFSSFFCGVSDATTLGPWPSPLRVERLRVNLSPLADWFGFGQIKVDGDGSEVSAKLSIPDNRTYHIDGAIIRILYGCRSPGRSSNNKITIEQTFDLEVEFEIPRTMDQAIRDFNAISDLIRLLIDTEYSLERPLFWFEDISAPFKIFTHYQSSKDNPPKIHECAVLFAAIADDFGIIFENWRRGLDSYGQGYYLYLGTRRGFPLYTEHRFINFMWQIESLHRAKFGDEQSAKLLIKIARIIDSVDLPKDKHWLEGRLKNAAEPNLKRRMIELFSPLSQHFGSSLFDRFCSECADRRNDMSHFGGARDPSHSREFLLRLNQLSGGLAVMTHAILLLDIGVDDKLVTNWLFNGFLSFRNRQFLIQAGLLDEKTAFPEMEVARLAHAELLSSENNATKGRLDDPGEDAIGSDKQELAEPSSQPTSRVSTTDTREP